MAEAAPLVLLAGLTTAGVLTLSAGSPLRIVAGIALVLVLPWLAASRLAALRESDPEGGRISAAGALSIALIILLGLLLAAGGSGIATHGIAVGMLCITAVLAVVGGPGGRPLPRPDLDRRSALGLALTMVAVAIAVLAFVVARDRALTRAKGETSYAAFLTNDGDKLDVGLSNSSGRAAVFRVRDSGEEDGAETTVTVPPKSTRMVKEFVDRPPSLKPRERLAPRRVEPVRIRVVVTVDGKQRGPALALSTYAR